MPYTIQQAAQAIKSVSDTITISGDGRLYGGGVLVATAPLGNTDFCVEVPTSIFNQVLTKLKQFKLWFEANESNLVINYDYGQFCLNGREPESSPINTSEEKLIYSLILTEELCQLVLEAHKFCANNDHRQDLNGVAIMPLDDKITVVATEGTMLYYKSVEADFYADSDVGFRFYSPLINLIKKFMPIGATVNVYHDGGSYEDGTINIIGKDLTLTQSFGYGRTNAKRIYESTTQLTDDFVGDSIILAENAELIRMAKMSDRRLSFDWQNGELTIYSDMYSFANKMVAAGADFNLILNPKNLLTIIGNNTSGQTMIKFSQGQKMAAINGIIARTLLSQKNRD